MYKNDTDKKIDEGLDYLNNNPNKSLEIFEDILDDNGMNVKALNGKGSALMKLNDYDGAEKCFDESLSIEENSSAYLNKGIILKKRQEYEEALDCYDNALKINKKLKNIIEVLKKEIQELLNQENRIKSISKFDNDIQLLIREGINYKNSNKIWDALDCYEYALKQEPKCQNLVNEYINDIKIIIQKEFIFRQPKFDDKEIGLVKLQVLKDILNNNQTVALININKVLDANPDDIDALNLKGCILFYLDDYEGAVYCYDQCIELNPNYVYAMFNKSLVLRRIKNYSEAVKCYHQIIKINQPSTNVEIYKEEILQRLSKLLEMRDGHRIRKGKYASI